MKDNYFGGWVPKFCKSLESHAVEKKNLKSENWVSLFGNEIKYEVNRDVTVDLI